MSKPTKTRPAGKQGRVLKVNNFGQSSGGSRQPNQIEELVRAFTSYSLRYIDALPAEEGGLGLRDLIDLLPALRGSPSAADLEFARLMLSVLGLAGLAPYLEEGDRAEIGELLRTHGARMAAEPQEPRPAQ
ncbi:MAG: hypothetical protein JKY65_26620 [Planctomycetes bacterium]|nr:hypothetical protein [Planctomycetota bacterium]